RGRAPPPRHCYLDRRPRAALPRDFVRDFDADARAFAERECERDAAEDPPPRPVLRGDSLAVARDVAVRDASVRDDVPPDVLLEVAPLDDDSSSVIAGDAIRALVSESLIVRALSTDRPLAAASHIRTHWRCSRSLSIAHMNCRASSSWPLTVS